MDGAGIDTALDGEQRVEVVERHQMLAHANEAFEHRSTFGQRLQSHNLCLHPRGHGVELLDECDNVRRGRLTILFAIEK
jgi:hypothetical protein